MGDTGNGTKIHFVTDKEIRTNFLLYIMISRPWIGSSPNSFRKLPETHIFDKFNSSSGWVF